MSIVRQVYGHVLTRYPRVGRVLQTAYRTVRPRRFTEMYGESYFAGHERRVHGVSGYGNYLRASSNADVAAYLLWRFLPFRRSFDVGCAKGFVVEALLEVGCDAHGADISQFAIEEADPAVRDRLAVLDLTSRRSRRRFRGESYDLVTTLEVLEHLDPKQVPAALRFLRSISSGWLVATIPSIGRNANGPDGFPDGKVRAAVLPAYKERGPGYDGPIPFDDLMKDASGQPLEGHICIASFEWWTRQFERAGFRRVPEVERAMHPVIGRFELSVAWNLYVFHVADRPAPPMVARTEDELRDVERRWSLAKRPAPAHALNITRDTVGDDAVAAILAEYERSQARAEPS